MQRNDRGEFVSILQGTYEAIGRKPPSPGSISVWWGVFSANDISDVRKAFTLALSKTTEFLTPAVVAQYLPGQAVWQGAEEAWATFPKSESDTGVITPQALEAWAVAREQWEQGDKVGARMAFRETYNRILEQVKRDCLMPAYRVSLGHNAQKRVTAISQAARKGLISEEVANRYLPMEKDSGHIAGLLTGKVSHLPQDKQTLTRLVELKKSLEKSNRENAAKKEADRLASIKDLEDRKQQHIDAAKAWEEEHLTEEGEALARMKIKESKEQ